MNKKVKKILSGITTAAVVLVAVIAFLTVGMRLFGLQVLIVRSGSMEPDIKTGSLLYVKDADIPSLSEGDVITYMLNEDTLCTHRITEVLADENDPSALNFRTKGDANQSLDGGLVHSNNVIGTPVFSLPLLGYVMAYIQNPPGTYIAISAGLVLLVLIILPETIPEKKKKAAEQEQTEQQNSK